MNGCWTVGVTLSFEIGFHVLHKESISTPNAKTMMKLTSPDSASLKIASARHFETVKYLNKTNTPRSLYKYVSLIRFLPIFSRPPRRLHLRPRGHYYPQDETKAQWLRTWPWDTRLCELENEKPELLMMFGCPSKESSFSNLARTQAARDTCRYTGLYVCVLPATK